MENVFLFSNTVSVDLKNFMLGCIWKNHCGYITFSTAYPRLKNWLELELSHLLRLGRSLLLSLEHFTIISLVSNADFPVHSVSQIYPNITKMAVIITRFYYDRHQETGKSCSGTLDQTCCPLLSHYCFTGTTAPILKVTNCIISRCKCHTSHSRDK